MIASARWPKIFLAVLGLLFLSCGTSLRIGPTVRSTAQWSAWRDPAAISGYVPSGPYTASLTFSRELGRPVVSTPLLAGETIIVGTLGKNLHTIPLATGETDERFWTGTPIQQTPVIHDSLLIAVGEDPFNQLRCLNLLTGEEVWNIPVGWCRAAPVVDSSGILLGLVSGRVAKVRLADGEHLWTVELTQPIVGLLLDGDAVLAVGAQGEVTRLSSSDGKRLARIELGQGVEALPISSPAGIWVVSGTGTLFLLDRTTLAKLKTIPLGHPVRGAPVITDARIEVLSLDGHYLRLDSLGHITRDVALEAGFAASPLRVGELLWTGTLEGRILALDSLGTVVHDFPAHRGILGGPAYIPGWLVFADMEGWVTAIRLTAKGN